MLRRAGSLTNRDTSGGIPTPAALLNRIGERWRWPIAMLLTAVAAFYAFSPLYKLVRGWNDSSFLYAAGRTWVTGFSPYEFDRWNAEWTIVRPIADIVQPMPFVYPPHWAPIAAPLALLPWPVASRLFDAINLVCYLGALWFALKLLGGTVREQLAKPAVWAFLAIATLNVAMRQSIFQAQLTLVPLVGIAGAIWAWHEKKTGWLVFFAFVASLKPQLSMLPLLYLFLNGGHVGVAIAGVIAAAVGAVAMLPSGIGRLPADFSHVMSLHTQLEFNQPSEYYNLPALAASFLSGQSFMIAGPILAFAIVVAMTVLRRRDAAPDVLRDPLWQLGILAALTAALLPVHAYDLVVYAPLGLILYRIAGSWASALLVGFIMIGGRSHLFARYFDVPLPPPIATVAIAAIVLFAAFRYRTGRNSDPVWTT